MMPIFDMEKNVHLAILFSKLNLKSKFINNFKNNKDSKIRMVSGQ